MSNELKENLEKSMIDTLTSGIFKTLSELPSEVRSRIRCQCGSREFSFVERLCDHAMLRMNVETGEIEHDTEYPDSWETFVCCVKCGKEVE